MTEHPAHTDPKREDCVDYDYAVVHLVPNVHLGAFVNVGVILHVRRLKFLDARLITAPDRLAPLAPSLDPSLTERFLTAYHRVCSGGPQAGPLGLLPPSERFHWLTAPRSAVIQTSAVHPGRCSSPEEALNALFAQYCGPGNEQSDNPHRQGTQSISAQ